MRMFTLLTAATRIRGISACLSSGSRTEHGSNLTYCSRIQAAVCSLLHSFPHERLCQRGCLSQGINLPSCSVRLEFEASPPASEGCSWVSLETDPHAGLLSGNDITCTAKVNCEQNATKSHHACIQYTSFGIMWM